MNPESRADIDSVGIRELRQHASRYVSRAKAGERIAVTDRGALVAYLVPSGATGDSILDRLEAAGHYHPPTGTLADLLAEPLGEPDGRPLSDVLAEMRDEERW